MKGYSRYIYQNKRDKSCFQHNMAYGDLRDLNRRTASDNFLCDRTFNTAKNPKYGGYQRGSASMVYKLLIKNLATGVDKSSADTSDGAIKSQINSNQKLAEYLFKHLLRTTFVVLIKQIYY